MNAWARIEEAIPLQSRTFIPATSMDRTGGARDEAKQGVLSLLRGLGTVMNFAKGAEIFRQDDNARAVYQVISGAVALCRIVPGGKRHIVDFRVAGEFFGVIARPSHTINAVAASDCILIAWRRGTVDEICDEVPSFRRSIEMLLAETVVTRGEIALAESRTARERVADFLLKASARAAEGGEAALPISSSDIGERIDAPCELVSEGLRALETSGAIMRTADGKLVVTNRALLQGEA